jgi:hypothetical protein
MKGGCPAKSHWRLALPFFVLKTDGSQSLNLAYRAARQQLEPNGTSFDWSLMDDALAAAQCAGVKMSLSVAAGIQTPRWVYNAGAPQFQFTAINELQMMPVPWDAIYLAKWQASVAALGARCRRPYNGKPRAVVRSACHSHRACRGNCVCSAPRRL